MEKKKRGTWFLILARIEARIYKVQQGYKYDIIKVVLPLTNTYIILSNK